MNLSEDRYKELLHAEGILDALYGAGVDNWEGYDEALSTLEESDVEESYEDIYGEDK